MFFQVFFRLFQKWSKAYFGARISSKVDQKPRGPPKKSKKSQKKPKVFQKSWGFLRKSIKNPQKRRKRPYLFALNRKKRENLVKDKQKKNLSFVPYFRVFSCYQNKRDQHISEKSKKSKTTNQAQKVNSVHLDRKNST